MQINWFTFIAQIVNFLILVGALKFLLYGRIVNAIEQREKKIHDRMEEADRKRSEAESEAESLREKKHDLEQRENEMLEEAKKKADERRQELVSEARKEVDELQKKWRDELDRQKREFLQDLKRMIGNEVEKTTGKALKDLANANLEGAVTEAFLRRLESMDKDEKDALEEALRDSKQIVVRSSFEVPDEKRERLSGRISEVFSKKPEVHFEVSSEPICGVALAAGGKKVSWSFAGYLQDLEEIFSDVMDSEIRKAEKQEGPEQKSRTDQVEEVASEPEAEKGGG